MVISCLAVDEIAVEGELTDQRVDLPEREGHGRAPLKIATDEAIGRHTEVERGLGRVLDGRRPVPLGEGEDTEDAPDTGAPQTAGTATPPRPLPP